MPTLKPISELRADFPSLAEGLVHLDGPAGTQVPAPVADAVAGAFRVALANQGGAFVSAERTDAVVAAARDALADLVGADPRGVVLGPNMTTLTFRFADTFAAGWGAGDEVVVTRLDHDANVRPWVLAAERAGATVRWADVDPGTCELPLEQFDDLIGPRTRLVAVTAASNAVGTRPAVRAIADRAHAVGALAFVDGVHATPHGPIDVEALGADLYAFSTYKLFGPHLGAVVADPELLETLHPAKLRPAPSGVPGRFEQGTGTFELMAALPALVDWLAALTDATAPRRERVLAAMTEIARYEDTLFGGVLSGLQELEGVTVHGAAADRTPTLSFRIDGWHPRAIAEQLGEQGICTWDGDYYATELMERLGVQATGGAVRIGLAPYTTAEELDRFLQAVAELAELEAMPAPAPA